VRKGELCSRKLKLISIKSCSYLGQITRVANQFHKFLSKKYSRSLLEGNIAAEAKLRP
jgi:hypothetical protein